MKRVLCCFLFLLLFFEVSKAWNLQYCCGIVKNCASSNYFLVVFDTTGGQKVASLLVTHGQQASAVDVPIKVGYKFLGYWQNKNRTGSQYFDAFGLPKIATWSINDHSTLYASWQESNDDNSDIILELDNSGGVANESHILYHNGEKLPLLDVPSRPGYVFEGYHDSAILGKKYYDSNGQSIKSWDKPRDGKLYAHWQRQENNDFVLSAIIIAFAVFVIGGLGGLVFVLLGETD